MSNVGFKTSLHQVPSFNNHKTFGVCEPISKPTEFPTLWFFQFYDDRRLLEQIIPIPTPLSEGY